MKGIPDVNSNHPQAELILGRATVHMSRTLMLEDLKRLFDAVPADASLEAYHRVVLEENVLLKPTAATRARSLQYLRRLYGLERSFILFGPLRQLWAQDVAARPLLALLTALVQDELFRSSAEFMVALPVGTVTSATALSVVVSTDHNAPLSKITLESVGQRTAASWTQSGHLTGPQTRRVRSRVQATPGSVAYAMLIGYLQGVRGLMLFETIWARLLDAQPAELDALAFAASQRGWLEYRRIGDVAEFGFAGLLVNAFDGLDTGLGLGVQRVERPVERPVDRKKTMDAHLRGVHVPN
jgi:hypothetical protein